MEIRNARIPNTHRQFGINNQTRAKIQRTLGPAVKALEGDGDKTTVEWEFTVDGIPCSIWDYRGSADRKQWSFFGPREIAVKLFGEENVTHGVY